MKLVRLSDRTELNAYDGIGEKIWGPLRFKILLTDSEEI